MGTKDKLSYERLISRVDYYKEKALDLEKKLVFAEETIERLENEMNSEQTLLLLEQKEKELQGLRSEVEELNKKLKRLEDHELEKRITGYEELLKNIQDEMNDKDQQIDLYQQRIKSMEKRININRTAEPVFEETEEDVSKSEAQNKEGINCQGYFDYSVIFTKEKKGFIRGSFYIENTGTETLENPYICFRFQPAEACALKGKIISLMASPTQDEMNQSVWMYMDNDWAEKAKERGEIWICPLRETKFKRGDKLTIEDFQIPFKTHIDENITVEAFVYFHKQNYRTKAVNHIAVNF
jgi:prefoldin subunit 5